MIATLKSGRGGLIVYDETLLGQPAPELFSPAYWRARGSLQVTAGGRGASWIVARDAGDWVLRHYRRGGGMRWLGDRYAWPGAAARTRPFREWRYLGEMHARGLPVPRPVAAHVNRTGLIYRGALITARIAPAEPLAAYLPDRLAAVPWEAVGRVLYDFHAQGAMHPDLNAHNILLGPNAEVHLIDFDRGGWRRVGGGWAAQNLARLQRSLLKIGGETLFEPVRNRAWPALLAGYRSG